MCLCLEREWAVDFFVLGKGGWVIRFVLVKRGSIILDLFVLWEDDWDIIFVRVGGG